MAARGLLGAVLTQDCLLCGAPSGNAVLCGVCCSSLPHLPAARCPVCALPTPTGEICGACLKSPPAFDASLAVWRYGFPVDKLVQALKYEHRLALSGLLAQAMLAAQQPVGDLIVALPLSPQRLRERGFNQAVEIARPLARALGLPLNLDDCRRVRETAPQARLPWKARRANVKNAFECRIDLSGQSVIVVDDVMTTGATLGEFAITLKRHGAVRVTNWVLARALRD